MLLNHKSVVKTSNVLYLNTSIPRFHPQHTCHDIPRYFRDYMLQAGHSKPNGVIDHRVCCSTVLARPVQYKKGEVGIRAKKQAFREERRLGGGKTTKDGQLHEETDKRTRLLYVVLVLNHTHRTTISGLSTYVVCPKQQNKADAPPPSVLLHISTFIVQIHRFQ